ncbi:hypothetical protein E2C01_069723 [Portunus trituberculatus]|uniref:Uncharacterized protein n=1 Tax=Portunus trituberculatus TaxID=210409 RepID=A0A5B7I1K5_PORTR|nr:hypothetical protein [Portunus trituberculatus]
MTQVTFDGEREEEEKEEGTKRGSGGVMIGREGGMCRDRGEEANNYRRATCQQCTFLTSMSVILRGF